MDDGSTVPDVPGYRILRPLGQGGMGAVYEAESLSTHETFALKIIREHLAADESYIIRFQREVKALCAIRHPNVVNVFEWSLPKPGSGDKPFVVMELIEGESLDALLKREPVVAPYPAVQIMLQVLEGLAAAHAQGILHRDLGPSNIFLERRASGKVRAKILDFGLARALVGEAAGHAVTQEGAVMGKPAYVAPELFHSQPLDERADIFACGIVLYRMLTGRFPYKAQDAQMLWVERWADREVPAEYDSTRTFAPELSEALDRVVAKSIRKDPAARYRSAKQMQRDLLRLEQSLLDDASTVAQTRPFALLEVSSSTVGGRPSAAKPASRSRLRLAAIAAIAVLAALAAVVVFHFVEGGGAASGTDRHVAAIASGSPGTVPPAGPEKPQAATGLGAAATPAAPAESLTFDEPEPTGAPEPYAAAADAGPPEPAPDGAATPELPATVRVTFRGVPDGTNVTVAGKTVDPSAGVDLARSDHPVTVRVTVAGGRYEPYEATVVPNHDQEVAVSLHPTSPARDRDATVASGAAADAGVRTGRGGIVRDLSFDEPNAGRDAGVRDEATRSDAGASTVREGRGGTTFVTNLGDDP